MAQLNSDSAISYRRQRYRVKCAETHPRSLSQLQVITLYQQCTEPSTDRGHKTSAGQAMEAANSAYPYANASADSIRTWLITYKVRTQLSKAMSCEISSHHTGENIINMPETVHRSWRQIKVVTPFRIKPIIYNTN